jgi:PIN domain nuclease of toxin-antitoxin system
MEAAGFNQLPVFSKHTVLVASLPLHHGDPFDRLLIAQAIEEPMHLLTTDTQLAQYSELVVHV